MRRLDHGWAGWLAALALVVPAAGIGAGQAVAATAPAWTVNKATSRIQFQSSAGGSPFTGAFGRWNVDIRFDPKNLAASSVLVRIDMGAADKDEAMPGADWFATAKFAQATYAAKSFKELGGGRYQALGTLTMRGVTRPLALNFQLAIAGDQARMVGSTMIDRHIFGVGQGQFAGPDTVPFAVKVSINLNARRG